MEDKVYIIGDVEDGNVARYINSSQGMLVSPNVYYTFVLDIPPWYTQVDTFVNLVEYGHIIVETLSDIPAGDKLFADYIVK